MLKKVAPLLAPVGGRNSWLINDKRQCAVFLQRGKCNDPVNDHLAQPGLVNAFLLCETIMRHWFWDYPALRMERRLHNVVPGEIRDAHCIATVREVLLDYEVPFIQTSLYVAAQGGTWDSSGKAATGWADIHARYFFAWLGSLTRTWVDLGQPFEVLCGHSEHNGCFGCFEYIYRTHSDTPAELLRYALTLDDETARRETVQCARRQLVAWKAAASSGRLNPTGMGVAQKEFDDVWREEKLLS